MQPSRNFPEGNLKLVEMKDRETVAIHAELPSTSKNRIRIHNMRNDMLMLNPKLDLRVVENNA